jgi:hypothetical protein
MFKKALYIASFTILAISVGTSAAVPKDIKYSSKSKTILGEKYRIYVVTCSDGSKRKISAWDNRKTWCVGTKKTNCSKDQLRTAKKVCK